jgi:hypothetical protein
VTDVHQDESACKRSRKRGRAQKQSEQVEPDLIKYGRTAMAKGKRLAATLKSGDAAEMELGELADRLQPKYGDNTLARFAKAIGLPFERLNRCRSVYRAYQGIEIQAPAPNFAVLQELAGHPNREQIIRERPDLTKREARTLMRDYRLGQGEEDQPHGQEQDQAQEQGQEQDHWQDQIRHLEPQLRWKVIEARHWLDAAKKHAQEAAKYGHPAEQHLDPEVLRHAVGDKDTLLATLRAGAKGLNTLADKVESALAPPALLPPPMFDDKATPGDSTPDQTT